VRLTGNFDQLCLFSIIKSNSILSRNSHIKSKSPIGLTVYPPLAGIQSHSGAQPNKNFNFYFSGLIEGDGSIIVPKYKRDKKGRLTYPSIQIVFGLMDLPLALIVQKTLGHGFIQRKKGKNAYILSINSTEGLIKTISLVNGKFKTSKIEALGKLIE
jgi:hypothetical protein